MFSFLLNEQRRAWNLRYCQAREAEERKAEDRSNPLKSAIETYALTGADVDDLISHFAAMDVDRQGECAWVGVRDGTVGRFPSKH